ncbi:MAG: S8 family serine peptidase, partial [Candidatus Thorarchaeota archaeon]
MRLDTYAVLEINEGFELRRTLGLLFVLLLPMFLPILPVGGNPTSPTGSSILHLDSQLRYELEQLNSGVLDDSPSYLDVILHFEDELSASQINDVSLLGVQFERIDSNVVHVGGLYHARTADIDTLERLNSFGLLSASSGQKRFFPSISRSIPETGASDIWENVIKDGVTIDGSGTRIAVIDTGVEWQHPSFWRNSSGEVQVLYIGGDYYADLNGDAHVDPNEGPISWIDLGSPSTIETYNEYMFLDSLNDGVFSYPDGDRWLGGVDANDDGVISLAVENVVLLNQSKVAILYDQSEDAVYYRGINLTSEAPTNTDYHGHGTHVSSIALGGQPELTSMVGAAPGADLIAIKSELYLSDIIDAIYFAIENDADIINMSFSSFIGYLDGTDAEDLLINEALMEHGVMSVAAAGNLGSSPKHSRVEVSTGSTVGIDMSVSSPSVGSYINILWQSDNDDEHIILESPSSSIIDLGEFNDIRDSTFVIDDPQIKAQVYVDTSLRGMNHVIIQRAETDDFFSSGAWSLEFENTAGSPVTVNYYVWDNSWSGSSLTLGSTESYRTISSPGTADLGICVGSYSESTGLIVSSSGTGPRIDGVAKPDIAAPGASIYAASRSLTSPWVYRSGTSMAAPHIAGVLALLRQAADTSDGWIELTSLIQGAGGVDNHFDTRNVDWGFGRCDAPYSLRHVMDIPFSNHGGLSDWVGVGILTQDPFDGDVDSELDLRSLRVYQGADNLGLASTMEGIPDFSSSSVFTIEWDYDDNVATGVNGADIVVNVSSGVSTLLEWTGASYTISTFTVEHWAQSSTFFLNIERPDVSGWGRIRVVTSIDSIITSDTIDFISLPNQWRPVVNHLDITTSESQTIVNMGLLDRESRNENLQVDWLVRDGNRTIITSGTEITTDSFNLILDDVTIQSSKGVSLELVVSDTDWVLPIPPILLHRGFGSHFYFSSLTLNVDSVQIDASPVEYITGEIVIEGYTAVQEVLITFRSNESEWINVTIYGDAGVFEFQISPSDIGVGDYQLFVVAHGFNGQYEEQELGNLTILPPFSYLSAIAAAFTVFVIQGICA